MKTKKKNKVKFVGSKPMKAVKVSKKVRELFKSPPMDPFNNLPAGFSGE